MHNTNYEESGFAQQQHDLDTSKKELNIPNSKGNQILNSNIYDC